jgi:hypothetical protein
LALNFGLGYCELFDIKSQSLNLGLLVYVVPDEEKERAGEEAENDRRLFVCLVECSIGEGSTPLNVTRRWLVSGGPEGATNGKKIVELEVEADEGDGEGGEANNTKDSGCSTSAATGAMGGSSTAPLFMPLLVLVLVLVLVLLVVAVVVPLPLPTLPSTTLKR